MRSPPVRHPPPPSPIPPGDVYQQIVALCGYNSLTFLDKTRTEYITDDFPVEYITQFSQRVSQIEKFYECMSNPNGLSVSNLTMTIISHIERLDPIFQTSSYADIRYFNFTMGELEFGGKVQTSFTSGMGLQVLIIFGIMLAAALFCCAFYECWILIKRINIVYPNGSYLEKASGTPGG